MMRNKLQRLMMNRLIRSCMLLAALCLFSTSRIAFAAPPQLTASSNPVIIPPDAASGTVTITWNTGVDLKGRVWLSIDGGAEQEFDPPKGTDSVRSGSRTQTVVPGSTYVFRLYSSNKATLWKELTVTTAKRLFPIDDGSTEESDIITDKSDISKGIRPDAGRLIEALRQISKVSVEPHGTFADVSFQTADAAVPMVLVSTKAPNTFKSITPKGEKAPAAFNTGDVVSSAFPLLAGKQTSHKVRVSNLQAGTHYHFVVEIVNAAGATVREKGSFTTLRRTVTVTFEQVHVIDDSDLLSAGDLFFGFAVNGQHDPNGEELTYAATIDSGKSRDFKVVAVVGDAPEELVIKVLCADDDKDDRSFEIGTKGKYNPYNWTNQGSTSDWDWLGVEGKYMLPGESETAVVPFQLGAKSNKLEYIIRGRYQVSYLATLPLIIQPITLQKPAVDKPLKIERIKPRPGN